MPVLFRFGRKDGSVFFCFFFCFLRMLAFINEIIVREIGVVKVILWVFFEIILFFRSFLHCGFFILEIIISSGSSGAGGNCESEKFS